jgi:hypothetical protein
MNKTMGCARTIVPIRAKAVFVTGHLSVPSRMDAGTLRNI